MRDGANWDDAFVASEGAWADLLRLDCETLAGAVNVLYGTLFSGLTSLNNQIWSQDSPGIDGMAEQSDAFGFPLTAGDFDGDGRG